MRKFLFFPPLLPKLSFIGVKCHKSVFLLTDLLIKQGSKCKMFFFSCCFGGQMHRRNTKMCEKK